MPYSAQHKQNTRDRIVESARILFNRHGFDRVTIDMVMHEAGLTRGGFYNHFASKEKLYQAAVASFLQGRGAQWRESAGVDSQRITAETTRNMLNSYLSAEHLDDLDGQCPMIALPSDTARQSAEVCESYEELLRSMVALFESDLASRTADSRQRALTLAALSVGGMVLARTIPDSALASEVREAALQAAQTLSG